MWVKYFSIYILFILPHISGGYRKSRAASEKSNLPFRYELEQVASDFQEKLRKELSVLEMEMYTEFLQLVQEIDGKQRNVTNDLTAKLSKKVSEVMEKFGKVIAFSTERTQVLNDKMKALTTSLGNWVQDDLNPSGLHHHTGSLQGKKANTRIVNNERTKRHTSHLRASEDDMSFQDVTKAKEMLTLDPDNFPLTEDNIKDIDAFLDSSSYFDGQMKNQDSDFTLPASAPDTSSRYVISKEKSREDLKSHPRKDVLPRNCYDLLQEGNTQNGVYVIYPSGKGVGIEVWCEQTVAGGGWTVVIARREGHPLLNFTRISTQYDHGFGTPSSNHWIGLEVMHELTQGISHTLKVHLQDQDGTHDYATYHTFRVASSKEKYLLEVGDYDSSSTAGDALSRHSGQPFSYPLPASDERCSQHLGVGWWYLDGPICYHALPTGQYYPGDQKQGADGVEWRPWKGTGYSPQSLQFMIRPSTA